MRKINIFFYISIFLVFDILIINFSHGATVSLPYKIHPYKSYDFPNKLEIKFLSGEYKKYQTNILKMFQKNRINLDQNLKRKQYSGNISWFQSQKNFSDQAKFKVTGDLFDHVKYENYFHSSLEIKLQNSNIAGLQNFKLFLMPARKGVDEIFVSLFFEKIGLISPYSKIIDVNFNGKEIKMLLQEIVTSKEIQNRYKLRESIFLKADDIEYYKKISEKNEFIICCNPRPVFDLPEDLITKEILVNAKNKYNRFRNPKKLSNSNLISFDHPYDQTYHFFLKLFGAEHAKSITNRIFYYDTMYNYLYPIYYDGDPNIKNENLDKINLKEHYLDNDIIKLLKDKSFYESFNSEFILRTKNKEFDISFYQNFLKKLIIDLVEFKQKDLNGTKNNFSFQNKFKEIDYKKNNIRIFSDEIKLINLNKLFKKNKNFDLDITFIVDKEYSGKIILNGDFDGHLNLNVDTKILNTNKKFKTRNKFLLTGCVSIIDSFIKNLTFNSNNSKCEDAINVIRSEINTVSFNVKNSYLDGIDFDGSYAGIENLLVNNSGNDCLDLSNGIYVIFTGKLGNCIDKGISVGEETKLKIYNSQIHNSNIGIAVKDSSNLEILENIFISKSKKCYDEYIKKNYFGDPKLTNKNKIFCS